MEEEDIPELKALFQRLKPIKPTSNFFAPERGPLREDLFSRDEQKKMDEEPLFSDCPFLPKSQRSINTSERRGHSFSQRQSLDLIPPVSVPERHLEILHKKHVYMGKEGAGKFGKVYKFTDLEDYRIKAVKVIQYKSSPL